MEKSSEIHLTEGEKAQIRAGSLPTRLDGWYTIDEMKEIVRAEDFKKGSDTK